MHPQGWRAPPRTRPLPCRHLMDPPDLLPTQKIPIDIETPRNKPRSGVPLLQASIATKNQSGARSGTLPEGETITGGNLHHEEGVVYAQG